MTPLPNSPTTVGLSCPSLFVSFTVWTAHISSQRTATRKFPSQSGTVSLSFRPYFFVIRPSQLFQLLNETFNFALAVRHRESGLATREPPRILACFYLFIIVVEQCHVTLFVNKWDSNSFKCLLLNTNNNVHSLWSDHTRGQIEFSWLIFFFEIRVNFSMLKVPSLCSRHVMVD